tara:strand:- start:260 stop:514 length:255 start_codon:yes stop_codon:yes gene_type:complete
MNRKHRIKNLLEDNFGEFSVEIVDNSHLHSGHNNFDGSNETHIMIKLLNQSSKNINRLDIHRKINKLLNNEFKMGLHSLEIKIN